MTIGCSEGSSFGACRDHCVALGISYMTCQRIMKNPRSAGDSCYRLSQPLPCSVVLKICEAGSVLLRCRVCDTTIPVCSRMVRATVIGMNPRPAGRSLAMQQDTLLLDGCASCLAGASRAAPAAAAAQALLCSTCVPCSTYVLLLTCSYSGTQCSHFETWQVCTAVHLQKQRVMGIDSSCPSDHQTR